MKLVLTLSALFLAIAPQQCAKDPEDETEISEEQAGYLEQDLQVRSTIEEWEKFRKEADSIILAGRVRISQATDCYDDSQTPHRSRLKSAIIKAESRLEKLSDKMLQARKYSTDAARFEASTAEEMENFKKDFRSKQRLLDEALLELGELY